MAGVGSGKNYFVNQLIKGYEEKLPDDTVKKHDPMLVLVITSRRSKVDELLAPKSKEGEEAEEAKESEEFLTEEDLPADDKVGKWDDYHRIYNDEFPKVEKTGKYLRFFVNRFGDPQHQGTLNNALRRIIRDYNEQELLTHTVKPVFLPHFSCHILRHTFTTRMCEAGVNIKVMQEVLGHADVSTTLNIYADVTQEYQQAAFADLEEHLSAHSPT